MAPPWNKLQSKGLVPNWRNWSRANIPTRKVRNDEISKNAKLDGKDTSARTGIVGAKVGR